MKKKIIVFTALVAASLIASNVGSAANLAKKINVIFNAITVQVNGQNVKSDNITYNGTTYVPLRSVAENLGKEIKWDGATNTANIVDKAEPQPQQKEKEKVYRTLNYTAYLHKDDKPYKIGYSNMVSDNEGNLYCNVSTLIMIHKLVMNDYTLIPVDNPDSVSINMRAVDKLIASEVYFSQGKVSEQSYKFYNKDQSKFYEVKINTDSHEGVVMVNNEPLIPLSAYMKKLDTNWGIKVQDRERTIIHYF